VLTEDDLDTDSLQAFYMAQEAADRALPVTDAEVWDAGSLRVTNVATPTATTDAANKAYVDAGGGGGVSDHGGLTGLTDDDHTQYLLKAGGQMTGNITMAGSETVDGRDLSADGSKLDGVESGATADQSAAEILTAIKTVDGAGTGLDADLLDGNEATAFATAAQGTTADSALQDVVDDTTPQLGGDLDVNGSSIVSASAGDIAITPNTTGDVILDGQKWPQADGSADQLLKTDGAGQLSWATASGAGLNNVVEDTTPQLGGNLDVNGNNITMTGAETVDGRDVSVDGTKLDGIESSATADQSAAEIMTAIQTVDGTGTGLDADLLDGQEATAFAQKGEVAGINAQTVSYTLVIGDKGKVVKVSNASANNLTVPLNSSVAFGVNTVIHLFQEGAGQTTVVATGGVTIRTPATLLLRGQYSMATLLKIGTDEWVLSGDLEAV
jgi:DNA-binding FrmR family transcriptional regulator